MLADFLKTFLVTAVMFFLFFYSAPYWTGAEMENLMRNGVYRAFYVLCSKLGYWAYQLIELVSAKICSRIEEKRRRAGPSLLIYTLLSLCLLAGSIMGLNQLYEHLFKEMFAVGGGITVSNEHTFLSRFSDLLIFFKLTAGYLDGTFLGFFRAVGRALLMCAAYLLGTMVFFSFLYGLLRQKVVPLKGDGSDADAPLSGGAKSLLEQCVDSVKDAVGNICYLRYFKVPGTLPPFLLIVAAYSLIQTWLGRDAEAGALLMDIVESTGVIDLVINFIIELILGKLLYCICIPIYRALPQGVQTKFQECSDRCDNWVQREKSRRAQWAQNHDFLQKLDGWATQSLHEMHLENDDWKRK